MKTKWFAALLFVFVLGLGWKLFGAQGGKGGQGGDVIITPLGAQAGEFCAPDRALLFEDPTGVRILTAPGRTVNGSADPRLGATGHPPPDR